jgi:hypothetical protein
MPLPATYFLVKIHETPAKMELILLLQKLESNQKAKFRYLKASSDLEAINGFLDSIYSGNTLY